MPPFFKYAKRFDSFSVIEKFNKELQSIDTHGTGFVPLNLFRSILEGELKIKEKIVLDFINCMRVTDASQSLQTLDVNLFTHSLRSHIDYALLLRKLCYYFEIRGNSHNQILHTEEEHPLGDGSEEVTLKIDIESAMRLKNEINEFEPPSTYVVVNFPFAGCVP